MYIIIPCQTFLSLRVYKGFEHLKSSSTTVLADKQKAGLNEVNVDVFVGAPRRINQRNKQGHINCFGWNCTCTPSLEPVEFVILLNKDTYPSELDLLAQTRPRLLKLNEFHATSN